MRIDAHHHFWKYQVQEYPWIDDSKSVLKRDFLPDDLESEIRASQINGVISVQARQSLEETHALLAYAEQNPWILGVVGWVPLADQSLAVTLETLVQSPKLRGVRHVVQDEPDDRFLVRPEIVRGIEQLHAFDLTYDLLVYPHQLSAAIELCDRLPNQRFVLDHIAKPVINADGIDERWRAWFKQLAQRPNVVCKFSGIITEVRDVAWTIDLIRPYWEITLNCFGPKRMMFGTDWPVCLLKGNYAQWTSTVSQLTESLSLAEQRAFWSETAMAAYQPA